MARGDKMEKASIGVVESNSRIYDRVGQFLLKQGHHVRRLPIADLMGQLALQPCDLILAADPLPGLSAAELLDHMEKSGLTLPVILVAQEGSVHQVVSAIRKGARDYLLFSDDDELLQKSIAAVLDGGPSLKHARYGRSVHPQIVTRTPAMQALLDVARQIAPSSATVLIQGESGTGKELIAKYIHLHSERRHHRFVAMNCAALPENLAESELFGHEKGAFTGALQRKCGKFEQAHNGTLLLDEIGEMSLPLQAKLLRVLQEREVDRIGGQKPVPVNVRVIATTNRDLGQLVCEERFRKDLYYRLRIIPLMLPPLRERQQDIPLLVDHFVRKFGDCEKQSLPQFTAAALAKMVQWPWPGNVRELENTIERALLICNQPSVGPEYLLLDELSKNPIPAHKAQLVGMTVKELEERLILHTLKHVNQNRTHAAEMLGISIRTLRNKLREYRQEEDVRISMDGM
ncbi:MAG: sigma-54-dependent Fis family transcriptional regulator [Desulfobacteraceae bacterium]|nr:MAG: sigma-54-dependent Fis family transcriptional regulator [Desulfobacteraceae bacterium]